MNQWDYPDENEKVVTSKDLYEILGVPRDANDSQIKRAYHKLAMVHHPDKRANNPQGSDETFKEIGYAYQVLSDSDKRAIYDQGGAAALEEQEGFANINLDHLMLNVLMWESGQKACFLCVLSLLLLEALIPPLLISLRMDGTLEWSWFGVTSPLWLPLALAGLLLLAAPIALRRQFRAAAEPGADPQLAAAARASALACGATTLLLGCIVSSGVMMCWKLDDDSAAWTFQQAAIPYYVVEGLLVVTYLGAPLWTALESLLGKAGRVATVALLCAKLDGATGVAWVAVLSPMAAVAMAGLAATLFDVRRHRRLKARGKAKDVTMEEEASRYAPFFFSLRGVLLVGFSLGLGLLSLRLCFEVPISFAQAVTPLLISVVLSFFMVSWGLLCFRPPGFPGGGGEYEQFPAGSDSYGTFRGGAEEYP